MLFDVGRSGGGEAEQMFVLAGEGKQRRPMPTSSPSRARQQLPKYILAKALAVRCQGDPIRP